MLNQFLIFTLYDILLLGMRPPFPPFGPPGMMMMMEGEEEEWEEEEEEETEDGAKKIQEYIRIRIY